MTTFEVWFVLVYVVFAGAGMAFVAYIVKTSGRDRPTDPEAVKRFIETAPRWQDDPRINRTSRQARGSAPHVLEPGTHDENSESTLTSRPQTES